MCARASCTAGMRPASMNRKKSAGVSDLAELNGGNHESYKPVLAIPGDAAIVRRHAEHRFGSRTQSGRGDLQASGPDSVEPGRRPRRAKRRRCRRSDQARLLCRLHQMDQGQSFQPAALPSQRPLHRRAAGHLVGRLRAKIRSRKEYDANACRKFRHAFRQAGALGRRQGRGRGAFDHGRRAGDLDGGGREIKNGLFARALKRGPMLGFTRPPCDAGIIRATPAFPAALSQRRKQLTLAATILGSSLAFIDGSVVNIALPAIQQALHADAASTRWIVNAYLLLLGALVLIGGSAACGLSPDITVLVVSRAVQGLGAALLTPASLAMLGATFDEQERSHAIGIWAGVGALTGAAGPVLGGWLVDQVSWRAIFLINVPLAIAAAGLAILFACESRDDRAKPLDWNGAVAVAIGLAAITWGLGAIPSLGFRDKTVLGALGAGIASLLAFVAIEARFRERAMMPLSPYHSRNFSGTNILTLLLYFALGGPMYFLPFGLIRLGGYSATQAGAALLPFALIMGFGASFAGTLADRFGARLSLTAGPIIAAGGLALLAFADLGKSYWASVFPAIGGARDRHHHHCSAADVDGDGIRGWRSGIASGVNNAIARVAGLLAVAALGAVLFASFSSRLPGITPAGANDALNAALAGQAEVVAGATAAFDRALRTVMLVTAVSAALAGIAGWLWVRPSDPDEPRNLS